MVLGADGFGPPFLTDAKGAPCCPPPNPPPPSRPPGTTRWSPEGMARPLPLLRRYALPSGAGRPLRHHSTVSDAEAAPLCFSRLVGSDHSTLVREIFPKKKYKKLTPTTHTPRVGRVSCCVVGEFPPQPSPEDSAVGGSVLRRVDHSAVARQRGARTVKHLSHTVDEWWTQRGCHSLPQQTQIIFHMNGPDSKPRRLPCAETFATVYRRVKVRGASSRPFPRPRVPSPRCP